MGASLMLWHLLQCKEEIKSRKALRKTSKNKNKLGPSSRRPHKVNVKNEKMGYEQSTCRVCLQYGDIPIYGVVDVSEELKLFTGIEITPGDSFPHYLCDFCSNQLEGAVSLRRSAQNSDRLLKQSTQNIIDNTVGDSGIFVEATYGSSSGIKHRQGNNNDDDDDESDDLQESRESPDHFIYQTELHNLHNIEEGATKNKQHRKQLDKNNTRSADDTLRKSTESKPPNLLYEEVNKKPFHCVKCNIGYETMEEYIKHRETEHENRRANCPVCSKSYLYRYLKTHIATHTEEKPFICDVCGKDFKNKGKFTRHCSSHSLTELPFKCSECPYRGRFRADLNFHMRTHTNDKRYQCPQCPTRFFINKSNLSRHMLTHRTDYDFNCDQCPRGFKTKRNLEIHFRVDHDGIKEHVCYDCGIAYGLRKTLMQHQRRVHKREKMRSGRTPLYMLLESRKKQEETSGQDCNLERVKITQY